MSNTEYIEDLPNESEKSEMKTPKIEITFLEKDDIHPQNDDSMVNTI